MLAMSVEKDTSEKCADKDSVSVNAAIPKRETSLRRTNEFFRSRYLSVTDLLQRVELQSEVSTKLFPLIDKERYQNTKLSTAELDDPLEDISAYLGTKDDLIEKPVDTDLSRDAHHMEANTLLYQTNQRTEMNKRSISPAENRSLKGSFPVTLVRRSLLPSDELLKECAIATRSGIGRSILFGVNTEYMVFSNQLKVCVKRYGNLPSRYGKKKYKCLIAKLCLLPENTDRQSVKVTNGLDTSLDRYSAYFNQSCAADLTRKKIGVSIYIKHGFFKRQDLICEWTVPLENFDFIEPQTSWKKIDL